MTVPPRLLLRSIAALLTALSAGAVVVAQIAPAAAPTTSDPTPEQATQELRRLWLEFLTRPAQPPRLQGAAPLPEAQRPEPERASVAAATNVSFVEPEEIRSVDGTLALTLVAMKAFNRIGNDLVYLRSYNGHLVGPTLRCKPGDTLRISLRNDLAPEPIRPGEMNTLHGFNVTNLHTHGLNVSPNGISDNVLLEVEPQSTQEYVIEIPKDHPCGTFWYHPHRHGSTAAQVTSGMTGTLIIEGGMDEVPEIKAARERVIMFQQIAYLNQIPGNPPKILPYGVVEQQYENYIFPPGSWKDLGRFTTINGIKLPVFRVRPGSVERWRFIHGGVREPISAKLERSPATPTGIPEIIALNEIAVDGLPLGKVVPRNQVDLWPGYRSDVLVQFPNVKGEYLLLDEASPAARSMDGIEENRKYLARVIIEGDPQPMALPPGSALAKFRLPSLKPDASRPVQESTYGIIVKDKVATFNVNGRPFNLDRARTLTLGATDDWVLKSENVIEGKPSAIPHPFHIHVNPFEVYSMKDDKGEEQLTDGPVWHDTIIIRGGWTIKMRTHYEKFAGLFVQHCHILDHEDQGMMELVEIKDPKAKPLAANPAAENPSLRVASAFAAPALALPDATGKMHQLDELRGKPTVLFFFKGAGCLHCSAQVAQFRARAEQFHQLGVNLVGVSSDTVEDLAAAQQSAPTPFLMLSDAAGTAFRAYDCFRDEPRHGTFVIDELGGVRWRAIGDAPFMALDTVMAEAMRLIPAPRTAVLGALVPAAAAVATAPVPAAPRFEIEVRNTPTPDDDYITWAPAPCRIRLAPGSAPTADVPVVLTNDPAQPVPPGRQTPLDGDVAFARTVAQGQTATLPELALTVPQDGSWVPFVIAGAFPRASTQDKDAVIEVHAGSATGPVLQTQALMVRIRKNHATLTPQERDRFLDALDYLNRGTPRDAQGLTRYMHFVQLHKVAAMGLDFGQVSPGPAYWWPDLAHKAPGFIAWHRAFLLLFEREIQKTHPDVALPYWIMPEPAKLFAEDFAGANPVGPDPEDPQPVEAKFSPNNPLYGWTADIDGAKGEPVQRFNVTRDANDPNFFAFTKDADLFKLSVFSTYPQKRPGGFVEQLEFNPHNMGHNWTGPWMQNCQTSPRDPIFWVFHAGFDRQWAHWQYLYGRFDPAGGNDSYCPLGTFAQPAPACGPGRPADCNAHTDNLCVPITHRLADQLWPWSGGSGKGTGGDKSNLPQPDLAQPFLQPYPASVVAGLWPKTDARPTPGDMIDYLGLTPDRLDMGFAYDDTPYGMQAKPSPAAASAEVFAQAEAPSQLLRSRTAPDAQRMKAMGAARAAGAPQWIDDTLAIVKSAEDGGPALDAEAINLLANEMMFTSEGSARQREILPVLEGALTDPRERVRLAALWALAPMGHGQHLTDLLVQSLQVPQGALFRPAAAIKGLLLASANRAQAAAIRPYLDSPDAEVRTVAVAALTTDPASGDAIRRLLADRRQPPAVRSAAIRAVISGGTSFLPAVLDVATATQEDAPLRAEAVAAIGALVRSVNSPLTAAETQQIISRLGAIPGPEAARIGPVVARTVLNTTQRLNRPTLR